MRIALAQDFNAVSRLAESSEQLDAASTLITAKHLEQTSIGAEYLAARAALDAERLDLPKALDGYRHAWEVTQHTPELAPDVRDSIEFSYADTLSMSSRFEEAERETARLLASQQHRLGTAHPRTCYTQVLLARTYGYTDRLDAAIPLAESGARCLVTALGPNGVHSLIANQIVADLLQAASDALGWTNPTVEGVRFHLADCRLDGHKTAGVSQLLGGLAPKTLNEGEIETDWEGRLAYESGRLALYSGDRTGALALLQTVVAMIATEHNDGHITEQRVRTVLEEAGRAGKTEPLLVSRRPKRN